MLRFSISSDCRAFSLIINDNIYSTEARERRMAVLPLIDGVTVTIDMTPLLFARYPTFDYVRWAGGAPEKLILYTGLHQKSLRLSIN